jgi:hypothetical protein
MIAINFLFQVLVFLGYVTFYDYEIYETFGIYYWWIIDGSVFFFLIIFSQLGYVAAV